MNLSDEIRRWLEPRLSSAEQFFGRLLGSASMLDGLHPNQVGQQRQLVVTSDDFQFQEVITTRSGNPLNTKVATITCGCDLGADPPQAPDLQMIGRLIWGIGGAGPHTVLFDWREGVQISVPASHITVQVRHQDGSNPPASIECRATIGWYPRGGRSLVTSSLDRRLLDVAGGILPNFTVYRMPPFAYSVQMFSPILFPFYTATTVLDFLSGQAGGIVIGTANGIDLRAALRNGEGIRLPAGTHSIRVTNNALAQVTVQPSFGTVL